MKPTAHMENVGLDYFQRVKDRALFHLKQNSRLTGLDKIRDEIAQEAAIRATGGPVRPMVLSKRCGEHTAEMQELAEDALIAATEAARKFA